MDPDSLSLLCNPRTHNPLELQRTQQADGGFEEHLVDHKTGEKFLIQDGIPVFYDAALLKDRDEYYNRFYHKLAGVYDGAMRTLAFFIGSSERKFRQQFLDDLEILPDSRVLEVSVGTGANLGLLPEQVHCYGLDLSWDMLRRCRKNASRWGRKIELFYGNAELLPFQDAMFDVVFHVGGINAFNDRAKALSEMVRVAKPGTRLVVVDETARSMQPFKWLPSIRKMLADWGDRFEAPVNYLPKGMLDVQSRLIIKDSFYVLSFRKPIR